MNGNCFNPPRVHDFDEELRKERQFCCISQEGFFQEIWRDCIAVEADWHNEGCLVCVRWARRGARFALPPALEGWSVCVCWKTRGAPFARCRRSKGALVCVRWKTRGARFARRLRSKGAWYVCVWHGWNPKVLDMFCFFSTAKTHSICSICSLSPGDHDSVVVLSFKFVIGQMVVHGPHTLYQVHSIAAVCMSRTLPTIVSKLRSWAKWKSKHVPAGLS